MARGWESKEIESQQDAAEQRRQQAAAPALSPAERERAQKRASLELSRQRVLHDLAACRSELYRGVLQRSLAFLDEELAKLDPAHPL